MVFPKATSVFEGGIHGCGSLSSPSGGKLLYVKEQLPPYFKILYISMTIS